jgi:G6PDH family F420-dependent oxidoreductase
MVAVGIFLSSEEQDGPTLVETARLAEQAGFGTLSISDHYHPWLSDQGESPFVWSVLGAIAASTDRVQVTTAVTCPTIRIHPAILAQATATTQQLFGGRFRFGVGSGEALNEHITGQRWPPIEVRLEMLEEALDVIRRLWSGETVDHHGSHYTVENARLWTLPEQPPPIIVSAFGPKAVALAARVAQGYYGTSPAKDLVDRYRQLGGVGPAVGQLKVCHDPDPGRAAVIAHRHWRHELIPGLGGQDLPTPTHFEQMAAVTSVEDAPGQWVLGADPDRHAAAVREFVDAGFDEVHVTQIGPHQRPMIEFYAEQVLPLLR